MLQELFSSAKEVRYTSYPSASYRSGSHLLNTNSIMNHIVTKMANPGLLAHSYLTRVSSSKPFGVGILRSFSSKKEATVDQRCNSVYVHPLSQMVLRYLQTNCHEWCVTKKLDKGLKLHRDGTFVLQAQPSNKSQSVETKTARIWTYYDPSEKKHWLSFTMVDYSADGIEDDKANEKAVQHRFLLQDLLMPAWHGSRRKNLSERVHESVLDLIYTVDQDLAKYETGNNHEHRRD